MTNLHVSKAIELCKSYGYDFYEELKRHTENGYVIVTPDCIMLAEEQENCWFVFLAVGPKCLKTFLDFMPYYKPWVRFKRGLRSEAIKTYSTEKLLRLL